MKRKIAALALAALASIAEPADAQRPAGDRILVDSPRRQTLYPFIPTTNEAAFAYIDFGPLKDNIGQASSNYMVLTSWGKMEFIDPRSFCDPGTFSRLKQFYDLGSTIQLLSFDKALQAPVRNPQIIYPGKTIEDTIIEERLEVVMPQLPTNMVLATHFRPISQLYRMDPNTGRAGEPMGFLTYAHDVHKQGSPLFVTYEGNDPRIKGHYMSGEKFDVLLPPREKVEELKQRLGGIFALPMQPSRFFAYNYSGPIPEPAFDKPLFSRYELGKGAFFKRLDVPVVIGDFNKEL